MEKICKQCDRKFEGRNEKSKFCSRKCATNALSTIKLVNCLNCNSEFKPHCSSKSKFCKIECYWQYRNDNPSIIIQSNQKDNRIDKICQCCHKEFKVFKYRKNNKFCSKKCFDDYRRNFIICPSCNKEFISPKYENKKYCSEQCYAKGINKRKTRFSEGVYEFLSKYYKCDKEVLFRFENKKYFCDILLVDYDIVIECNGDYWYCNPFIYNENYYNSKVGKTAHDIWEIDSIKKQNFLSINCSYIVIWEYDWNNDENILNKIKNEIEYEICKNKKNKKG